MTYGGLELVNKIWIKNLKSKILLVSSNINLYNIKLYLSSNIDLYNIIKNPSNLLGSE